MAKEDSNLPHTHCQKAKSLLNHPGHPLANTEQYLIASLLCPIYPLNISAPDGQNEVTVPYVPLTEFQKTLSRFVWWRLSSSFYRWTLWHRRGWGDCLTLYSYVLQHHLWQTSSSRCDVIKGGMSPEGAPYLDTWSRPSYIVFSQEKTLQLQV